MKAIFKKSCALYISICILGIFASLLWILELSPRPYDIEIITPELSIKTPNDSSLINKDFDTQHAGLFWVKFKTSPQIWPLKQLNLRTFSCLNILSANEVDFSLPSNKQEVCDNHRGILLQGTDKALSGTTTWTVAGMTEGSSFGVHLTKSWMELPVLIGLCTMLFFLIMLLAQTLPKSNLPERGLSIFFLVCAFLLRFWFVFIESPPELSLFSDMGGYFARAEEIRQGLFNTQQLFQPIGFTLWSLWIRKLGGFELFNWLQVFFAWGTVLFIYLIAKERLGKYPALVALAFASFHIPLAGFASFHMAENIYAFLITLILWQILKALKGDKLILYFWVGGLLGLAFYFKGNHAFFIPLLFAGLLYLNRHDLKKALQKSIFLGVGGLLVLSSHLIWTNINYGKAYVGPTAGALNFVEGKCPSKDNADSLGARWMSPLFAFTNERTFKQWDRPFTDQAYFWKEGWKCIQENPLVLIKSLRYVYYLIWGNDLWPLISTPLKSWYHAWSFFFYYIFLPLSLLGLLMQLKDRNPFSRCCLLLFLSLCITVWFFKSENRFRVPFDSLFILWASVGFSWLGQRFQLPEINTKSIHDPQMD